MKPVGVEENTSRMVPTPVRTGPRAWSLLDAMDPAVRPQSGNSGVTEKVTDRLLFRGHCRTATAPGFLREVETKSKVFPRYLVHDRCAID